MSSQDRLEKVLRDIHVMISKSEAYGTDRIIVNKNDMFDLIDRLNASVYEIMDEYELTQQSRDKALRENKKEGDKIIWDASRQAEDIYAASVMYTDEALNHLHGIVEETRSTISRMYADFQADMKRQQETLRENQLELKSQLQLLVDSEKYLSLIEERNKEIKREEAVRKGKVVGEKGREKEAEKESENIYASRKPEIKINKEYFRRAGIPIDEPETIEPQEEAFLGDIDEGVIESTLRKVAVDVQQVSGQAVSAGQEAPGMQPGSGAQPGLGVQSGLGVQLASDTQSGPGEQPMPEVQAGSVVQEASNTQSGSEVQGAIAGQPTSGVQPVSDTQPGPGGQTLIGAQSESEIQAVSGIQAGPTDQVVSGIQAGPTDQVVSGVQAGSADQAVSGVQSDLSVQTVTVVQPGFAGQVGAENQPGVQTVAGVQSGLAGQAVPGVQLEPGNQMTTGSHSGLAGQAMSESQSGTGVHGEGTDRAALGQHKAGYVAMESLPDDGVIGEPKPLAKPENEIKVNLNAEYFKRKNAQAAGEQAPAEPALEPQTRPVEKLSLFDRLMGKKK